MLLNHERRRPHEWDDALPSLCPDCGSMLLAKRGPIVVWHWAHRAGVTPSASHCLYHETQWHLRWKAVYHAFPNWEIEVPITLDGIAYRADAANLSNGYGSWREFVHTLTDAYIAKHLALENDVPW
jgi:hypothetical protein